MGSCFVVIILQHQAVFSSSHPPVTKGCLLIGPCVLKCLQGLVRTAASFFRGSHLSLDTEGDSMRLHSGDLFLRYLEEALLARGVLSVVVR